MDGADDGEAVFRLVVSDRVTAGEDRARLRHGLACSLQDLAEQLGRELLREGRDRQREQRRPAHREDVVEGVRGRDRAERVRVVDDRREEVDREDERAVVVEPVDGGVVGGVEPDQEVSGVRRDEPGEELLEPRRRVLRGAAPRFRQRGERRCLRHHCRVYAREGVAAARREHGRRRDPYPLPSPPKKQTKAAFPGRPSVYPRPDIPLQPGVAASALLPGLTLRGLAGSLPAEQLERAAL